MKKLGIGFVLLFAIVLSANAIHPDKLINQLSQEKNVAIETVEGEELAEIMKAKEEMSVFEGLKAIHVIALEDSPVDVMQNYKYMIDNLEDIDGYQTLIQVKDREDTVRIMLRTENDVVQGVYLFVADDEDIVVVQLQGNISQEGIETLIKEQTKNN